MINSTFQTQSISSQETPTDKSTCVSTCYTGDALKTRTFDKTRRRPNEDVDEEYKDEWKKPWAD